MTNELKKLIDALDRLFGSFPKISDEVVFEYVCGLDDSQAISKLDYPGLYLIEIHTGGGPNEVNHWISELQLEWEHEDYKKKHTSNFKKVRIKAHTELPEWMPLYIGKSKKVSKRVWEHIHLELEKPTYAMKIAARPTMAKRKFRLSVYRLPKEHYDIIAPKLESAMRQKLNPLIGRQ